MTTETQRRALDAIKIEANNIIDTIRDRHISKGDQKRYVVNAAKLIHEAVQDIEALTPPAASKVKPAIQAVMKEKPPRTPPAVAAQGVTDEELKEASEMGLKVCETLSHCNKFDNIREPLVFATNGIDQIFFTVSHLKTLIKAATAPNACADKGE